MIPKRFEIAVERTFSRLWNSYLSKMEFGLKPKEYNPKVHGPYVPYRYYGTPDKAFGELKLAEIPAWVQRRNKSVTTTAQLISRGVARWSKNYKDVRYGNLAWVYQLVFIMAAYCYTIRYEQYYYEKKYRYHW